MESNQFGMTDFLAVWGSITGTLAILWDVYKWKTTGPQIVMKAFPNMVTAEPGVGVDHTLHIAIDVTNTGSAKTTLKSLAVACYSSRWSQWRNKPEKTFVVINTGPFCRALPQVLEVGEIWRPFLPQDQIMKGIEHETLVFFQLWHSASNKPVSAQLVIPRD